MPEDGFAKTPSRREPSASNDASQQQESAFPLLADILGESNPQVGQNVDLREKAPQNTSTKRGAKTRATNKKASKPSTVASTSYENSAKAPEDTATNALLKSLVDSMNNFIQESRDERTELVNTLHSVNDSMAAMSYQADNMSDSDSSSEPENNPPKRPRLSDNSDSVGEQVDNLVQRAAGESTQPEKEPASFLQEFLSEFNEDNTGPDIDKELAAIVNGSMTKALPEDKLKTLLDKYPRSQNCESVIVPKVNPEVWTKLTSNVRSNDIKIQKVEKFLCKAVTSLGIMADKLLKTKESSKDLKEAHISDTVKTVLDSIRFIGQAQQELHQLRRIAIKPDLNQDYRQLCTSQVTATKLLFGDDLPKAVKDLNEVNKMTGKLAYKGRNKPGHFKGKPFLFNRPHQYQKSHNWHKNRGHHQFKGKYNKKSQQSNQA